MKRKVSLFLCMVMIFSLLIPFQSFADSNTGLENAIKIAKTNFNIPTGYTFSADVYTQDNHTVWNMSWKSKDNVDTSITVRVNDSGSILGYDNYKPMDYSRKKLPKINREAALLKAQEFINRINPEAASNLKLMDNNQPMTLDTMYYFSFARTINNVPFYENNLSVNVNSQTGEVQSYNYNWTEELVFPDKDKVISLKDAEKAYTEKLGLSLIYKYTYENDIIKTYLVYTSKFNSTYSIDALTGEKVQTGYPFYGYGRGGAMMEKSMMSISSMDMAQVNLTPEEIKAVEEASKIITKEKAESIARDFATLKITDSFKLVNTYLSKGWPDRSSYYWDLNFTEDLGEKSTDYRTVSVNINAITGEIRSFYTSYPSKEGDKAKYDKATSKTAVENFLKTLNSEKFNNTEFDENYTEGAIYSSTEQPTAYNFSYVRKVNGVLFPENTITVGYDAIHGEITNLNMNWFDVSFPASDKVISSEVIYNYLFAEIGLELQYKLTYNNDIYAKMGYQNPDVKPEVKLVYSVNSSKPLFLSPTTGGILDYEGKPYVEYKPVEYTDIKGNFAEKQIEILAEYGISLEGNKFKPNEGISQKDFLTLLTKALNSYYGPVITSSSTQTDIDGFYSFLIREGIVKESEKSPNSIVTREDGIKYFIRALKYDKVADIKGIFNCTFKDKDKISPDLIGYITIAQGLKLISGEGANFNPKDKLTRAQTITIIYNYLQN